MISLMYMKNLNLMISVELRIESAKEAMKAELLAQIMQLKIIMKHLIIIRLILLERT